MIDTWSPHWAGFHDRPRRRRVHQADGEKAVYAPGARALVLGLTVNENCSDQRDTRVAGLVEALADYNLEVDVDDPWADPEEAREEYGIELVPDAQPAAYAAITVAVAHDQFRRLTNPGIRRWASENAVIYDLKHILPQDQVDGRL